MTPTTLHSRAEKRWEHNPRGQDEPCSQEEQGVTGPAAHAWGQSITGGGQDKPMKGKVCKVPNQETQHQKVPKDPVTTEPFSLPCGVPGAAVSG